MKRFSFLLVCILAMIGCEVQNVDDTKPIEPTIPANWSPAGKVFVYETTWEKSPAVDRYWVWVRTFYTKDSLISYETSNRDLSYNLDYSYLIDTLSYTYKDQIKQIDISRFGEIAYSFDIIDTCTLYVPFDDGMYFKLRQ